MAEKLISNLLDQLISIPSIQLQNHINLVTNVEDEVSNLHFKLTMIYNRLRDAEMKKLTNNAVRYWYEKFEDLAYEMDDVLDEWNSEIHKYRIQVAQTVNPSSSLKFWDEVCSFFLTYCLCFKEKCIRFDIRLQIRLLNGRLNLIFKEWEDFKFVELNSVSQDFQRPQSTSIFNESDIAGRHNDKNIVVNQLLFANYGNNIGIVSIVGTGGIGKTTLAQVVCNDGQVKKHFQLIKWVCVSDTFDQKRIAKAILENVDTSSSNVFELETLVNRIKELVYGKRFLLVLDDVWTEDYSKWEQIWNSLKHGAPGSKILVTTRSERVAIVMGTDYKHSLGHLLDSDCWNILSRVAFSRGSFSGVKRERLAKIGFEIAKKCKGLPLAAKFLGSLLRLKDTVEQWRNILESEIWELEEATIHLFPHIYLSYNELSPEMKRCFLYCAIYPKDFEIDVRVLIREWMAQGYLSSGRRVGDLESRGYECFNNLAMRSFFQILELTPYYECGNSMCKMHDIVHDFAQHLTNGECLIIDQDLDEENHLSCERVRHLRWLYHGDVAVGYIIMNVGKLRSFYSQGNRVAPDFFHGLKSVRHLTLREAILKEVPIAVGKLIHLRFLNLHMYPFEVLPEEICDLYNLKTLDISFCMQLTRLPQRIGNLTNLRHLLNSRTDGIKQLPQGLEKLTALRTLEEFKVGNKYGKFEYLKNLNQLKGGLKIEFYDVNEADFNVASFEVPSHIQKLVLVFYGEKTNFAPLIEHLQVPQNLESLYLTLYPGSNLPRWIMSLNNIRILVISECFNIVALPGLGQLPSLEKLKLYELEKIKVLERDFMLGITESRRPVQIFPKLKKLVIHGLNNLREWEDLREEDGDFVSAVMPSLEMLSIWRCRVLENLPHRLLKKSPSLKRLLLAYCKTLQDRYRNDTVVKRGLECGNGKDWIHISHIPNVKFTDL